MYNIHMQHTYSPYAAGFPPVPEVKEMKGRGTLAERVAREINANTSFVSNEDYQLYLYPNLR